MLFINILTTFFMLQAGNAIWFFITDSETAISTAFANLVFTAFTSLAIYLNLKLTSCK